MGRGALSETQLVELNGIMTNLLDTHFKGQEERQEQRKDEDYDDDVEDNLINQVSRNILM